MSKQPEFSGKKLIDFLLKGFSLTSSLSGGFKPKSAHKTFDAISDLFMPEYVKSTLDLILKFQDRSSKSTIGEVLSPSDGSTGRSMRVSNFEKDLVQTGKVKGQFSDIFDLGDTVGEPLSQLMGLGGVFISDFIEQVS